MPADDASEAMVDMRDEYDRRSSLIICGGSISFAEYSSISASWSSSLRKRGKDGGDEATGKCRSSPASSMERKAITSRPSLESILDRVNRQGSQGDRHREENPLAVIDEQTKTVSSF